MYLIGKKPALVLGTTAVFALGATGISAQARSTAGGGSASAAGTPGRGLDPAALATQLGVTEAELATAMAAVRAELGAPDRTADLQAEAAAIAEALGVSDDTVLTVLEARIKTKAQPQPQATDAGATTPSAPPARRRGGRDQAALVAALVTATGKTEREVRAALAAGRTAHDEAEAARQAKFAALLAAKLGLDSSKVTAALEAVTPARPSRPAQTPVGATS